MKTSIKKQVLTFVVAMLGVLAVVKFMPETPKKTETVEAAAVAPVPPPESADDKWIDKLEVCESGDDAAAINQKDVDGTPSYGAFQFKPGTFTAYAKKYGVEGTLMDPAAQRAIVTAMVQDPSTDWHWQFPVCTDKLGLPP